MKMKNMLIGGMSLALVACISIGGTLAYLTDKTGEVTNTVHFTTNGIDLTLTETSDADEADKEFASEGSGINYNDVVPGADLNKEPVLTVAGNNVDCYVYALVTGVDETTTKAMYTEWNDEAWTVVNTEGLVTDQSKQFPEGAVLLRYKTVVQNNTVATPLPAIFDTVTVNDDLEYNAKTKTWMLGEDVVTLSNIEIKGYAIQANNLVDSEDLTGEQAIAVANTEAANAFAVAK